MPFLNPFFKSDSPLPEDSDSLPSRASTPLNDGATSSYDINDIDSSSDEQKWINNSMLQCILTFIMPLSPLPGWEEILLHHLYDIRMFSHHIQYNTTAAAANAIPTMLNGNLHQLLQTLFKMEKLLDTLSDLKANTIHMCRNSCCIFNGLFAKSNHCPFCKHTWRDRQGSPYKIFQLIPLIPRLQAMYANPNMAKVMCYHTNYHRPDHQENTENANQKHNNAFSPPPTQPNNTPPPSPCPSIPPSSPLKNIFDGQHYCHLCQEQVTTPLENEEGFNTLQHRYFEDKQDVVLGLALDSFTFYKTLGKSAQKTKYNTWELIIINYNLNPTIRTHCKHIIPLGMIPGPGSPKHISLFLY